MMRVKIGSRRVSNETLTDLPEELQNQTSTHRSQVYRRMNLVYNDQQLHRLVGKIHEKTVEDYDFKPEHVQRLRREQKSAESHSYVQDRIVETMSDHAEDPDVRTLTSDDRESVIEAVVNEILGFGPLEPLLDDDNISDILVNTCDQVFIERRGKGRLERLPEIRFRDNRHLKSTIDRIVNEVQREVNERSPMVDARIDRVRGDGEVQRIRVNAIIEPLSIEGPVLSIRKFPQDQMRLWKLVENQTLTQGMADLLEKICQAKLNVLISGGTGSGKTTLLNALSGAIPQDERIVTIEDTAELYLQQDHVVRLETRPPRPDMKDVPHQGEITQRDLVKNSLRMRPDRIIVGEVRGDEALDMLQAMNTGHDGSLTTIHANSGRDALTRLETMVAMVSGNASPRFIRQSISRAFQVVLHTARIGDHRKLVSLLEITGMQDDVISMQEIFAFEQTGLEGGRVQGVFVAKGVVPEFLRRFEVRSIPLPDYSVFKAPT